MKRYILFLIIICISLNFNIAYAAQGEGGYFGGVSDGSKLPKIMDKYVKKTTTTTSKKFNYKEPVLLTGQPLIFEGTVQFRKSMVTASTPDTGSYTQGYTVTTTNTTNTALPQISRTMNLKINYRKVDKQTTKDIQLTSWSETITVGGKSYVLNPNESVYTQTIIEDTTPGITYYRGDLYCKAVYEVGDEKIIQTTTGKIYGYEEPWSTTETQLLDRVIDKIAKDGTSTQLHVKINPSITANKIIQYDKNDPTLISFDGSYQQVLQNNGGLNYRIISGFGNLENEKKEGSISVSSPNSFEQLVIPKDTEYLKGHFAEDAIKKLYSMEILEGNAKYFVPSSDFPRSEYVRALCRTMNIEPQQQSTKTTSKKQQTQVVTFGDVTQTHKDYNYITSAYNSGLIKGRQNGNFYPDESINREEAIGIYIRILGMDSLADQNTQYTPFVDDESISPWAKKSVYIAYQLGLVKGDGRGYFRPKDKISKAEGAIIINRMIEYLRSGIEKDYREKLINY